MGGVVVVVGGVEVFGVVAVGWGSPIPLGLGGSVCRDIYLRYLVISAPGRSCTRAHRRPDALAVFVNY